jgi:phospholipase C
MDSLNSIKHVVVLMQENRSFDQYFGTFPGAAGFTDPNFIVNSGLLPSLPFRNSTFSANGEQRPGDNHLWKDMHLGYTPNEGCLPVPADNAVPVNGKTISYGYGYYAANDIPYHWLLASTFTLCDHWFGSVLAATAPNRLYLMSGCMRDPGGPFNAPGDQAWDTTGDPWSKTANVDAAGNVVFQFPSGALPWDSYPVMLRHAQASGQISNAITWNVYDETSDESYLVTSGDPSFNIPGINGGFIPPPNMTNGWGTLNILNAFADPAASNWTSPTGSFIGDAAAGSLPTISWLIPPFGASEWHNHPSDGAQYIAQRLNAILNSGLWNSTVFIVIYDESDGAYDHVDPQPPGAPDPNAGNVEAFVNWEPAQPSPNDPVGTFGPLGPGYRIPAFIISPWTVNPTKKPGWDASEIVANVNSQPCDHTAVLQLLEIITQVPCSNIGAWRRNRFNCGENFWNNIFDFANPVAAADVLQLLPAPAEVTTYQENVQLRLMAYVGPTGASTPDYIGAPSSTPSWPLPQLCYFLILSQTSFGLDDVNAAQQTSTGFTYGIVLDRFETNEMAGLTILTTAPPSPLPRSRSPTLYVYFSGTDADALGAIAIAPNITISPQPPTAAQRVTPAVSDATRWTVMFSLIFANPAAAFTNVSPATPISLTVNAVFSSNLDWSTSFPIELVAGADPFMLTGPIQYLATDLRAYQVLDDGTTNNSFNLAFGGDPNAYVTEILSKLNTGDPAVAALAASFATDPASAADPDAAEDAVSQVAHFPTEVSNGVTTLVYNFAIARVSLQGISDPAANVQVFFRLFPTPSSGTYFTGYDSGSAYASVAATNPNVPNPPALRMPTVGTAGGQILTIPFFAAPRSTVTTANPDLANWQATITPLASGGPVYTYFGCWLDINQPNVSITYTNAGGSQSSILLAAYAASEHQCLVAEIAFSPLTVAPGAVPGLTTDLLAQRNLAVLGGTS